MVDNAPAYSRLELLEEEFEDVQVLRLAPYSYLLNPIELVWSSFKSNVKRELRNQIKSLLNASISAGETISEHAGNYCQRPQIGFSVIMPLL